MQIVKLLRSCQAIVSFIFACMQMKGPRQGKGCMAKGEKEHERVDEAIASELDVV